ncbi:MAG: ATP-binding protein [Methyloligellaceae bacterium]
MGILRTTILYRPVVRVAGLVAVAAPLGDAAAAPLVSIAAAQTDPRTLLIVGVITGLIMFSVVSAISFLRAMRSARQAETAAKANAVRLDEELDVIHSMLVAEPQVLVHWDEVGTARIVAATLDSGLGLPHEIDRLLRFSDWLERDSACELDSHLADLRSEGAAFNVMLKTATGGHVEADGRAAGGGCMIKFRDLAGRRRQLANLADRHRRFDQDIQSLRALLDALPMPVWFRGTDGGLQWVNRAYAAAVESSDSADVCEQQIELLELRDRETVDRHIAGGEAFRNRIQAMVAGGSRTYDAIVLPVGRTSAGVVIAEGGGDTAESTLNRYVEAHVRTLDQIATAVAVYTPDQHLTYYNQAFVDLWQLDPDWLSTGPCDGEVLDRMRALRRLPEQADYRSWKRTQLASYGSDTPREDFWYLPDGRTIHTVAERGTDGGVTYLYEDVTERLSLESRYNALINVQKETLDHLREGVAVFASDGRLKLFNPAFAGIWQLDSQALSQEPHIDGVIAACRALLDDDAAWSEVKSAVTGIDDQRKPIEGQLSRPDGSALYYAGLPLPDGATLLTYADITDTKRVEHALIERNEALEAADGLKNAFISHVSYELRAPLTNIIGFGELLANPAMGSLNEKQQDYLSDIRSSSDALLAIVNDILDLATIDAGALELRLSPVKVSDVVDAAVLGVRDRLQRAELGLDIHIDEDISRFEADEKRVTQVLYNLLSNAIGFSSEGSTIRLATRRAGEMIAISVEDEGRGIAVEDQPAVFDRFESRRQGSNHRGAGLGLSIVKSLVELHGGEVSLLSAPDMGTTVTVRLPIMRSGAATEDGKSDTPDAAPAGAEGDASPAAA